MAERTGGPLTESDYAAIQEALASLPDDLGQRVAAGLACAAALGDRITMIREGDTAVPGSRWGVDKAETKERFKDALLSGVATNIGIAEPTSEAARSEVRSQLAWTGLLATGLRFPIAR